MEVLRIDYGTTSFLFTGDAETMAEYTMLSGDVPLSADVLKVGHHGSHTSSDFDFLSAVNPWYAVISCGKDNAYGHPHPETLEKLFEMNVDVFRTDLQGTIKAVSNGNTIEFTIEKEATQEALFSSPYNNMSMTDLKE